MIIIGSANYLDLTCVVDSRKKFKPIGEYDPVHIREDIRLQEASNNLFPTIMTGVRFWPFLLVARDLQGASDNKILNRLGKIQKNQPSKYGPATIATYRFYDRMYQLLQNNGATSCQGLKQFINDRRRIYDGNPAIFRDNNQLWKRVLITSLGKAGAQFAKLVKNEMKFGQEESDFVEKAITSILREARKYESSLVHAAACYAFMRSMYGINDIDGVKTHEKAHEWAKFLLKSIEDGQLEAFSMFTKYCQLIRSARKVTPWAGLAEKLIRDNRRILSDLRFHVFYRLYFKPTPERGV